jgi:hypothetical protein
MSRKKTLLVLIKRHTDRDALALEEHEHDKHATWRQRLNCIEVRYIAGHLEGDPGVANEEVGRG